MMDCIHLAHIVEVPVGHCLLCCQLPELVEEDMQLELVGQVGQTPIAEALQGT